jgi:hypothetical protein
MGLPREGVEGVLERERTLGQQASLKRLVVEELVA